MNKFRAQVVCPTCGPLGKPKYTFIEAGLEVSISPTQWDIAQNWCCTEHNRITGHQARVHVEEVPNEVVNA